MSGAADEDRRAIEQVIARQFSALTWSPGSPADWAGFAADFLRDATLYAATRPASKQTVEEFVERMEGLAGNKLQSFHERVLGTEIRVFGNVAVALAAGEMVENGTETTRSVEMMLLVKSDGAWRIVSQAWDRETEGNAIPSDLIGAGVA